MLHVNDVAGVATTLVHNAHSRGRNWHFRALPPARPPFTKAAFLRAIDFKRWLKERRTADLLHIHYGPNGYLGWGASAPYILHLHGSDLRLDLHKKGIGALTRSAIERASAVLYSTQDMKEAATHIRPDARWLPNPLPPEVFQPLNVQVEKKKIIFATRWDHSKGARHLISGAKTLIANGYDVHGLDWGSEASLAYTTGVQLHPLMSRTDFLKFMASAQIVIGQHSFGVPGLTELQAMAIGRPLAMYAPGVPVVQTHAQSLGEEVLIALSQPDLLHERAQQAQQWVLNHHDPSNVVTQLEVFYDEILRNY